VRSDSVESGGDGEGSGGGGGESLGSSNAGEGGSGGWGAWGGDGGEGLEFCAPHIGGEGNGEVLGIRSETSGDSRYSWESCCHNVTLGPE